MINVTDAVKNMYKMDSEYKTYFVIFRESSIVLTNHEIVSESLRITESICSSSQFKVGLCEAAVCSFDAYIQKNVTKDELCLFQCLGNFDPTWDTDNNYGVTVSGEGVTQLYSAQNSISNNVILGDNNSLYQANENYLILAKVRYIYKEIQLYVTSSYGINKTVYYISPDVLGEKEAEPWSDSDSYDYGEIVIHNSYAWRSVKNGNTDEPNDQNVTWENATKEFQIAIPIPGNDFTIYNCSLLSTDVSLKYAAKMYKIDHPILPLGLYQVSECKSSNGGDVRNIVGYDRMNNVGLSENIKISYDSTGTTVGAVIDASTENTQLGIGSNLTIEDANHRVISSNIEDVPNWPSNPIYEKNYTKVISGTYNRNGSGYYYHTEPSLESANYVRAVGNVRWVLQYRIFDDDTPGGVIPPYYERKLIYYPVCDGFKYYPALSEYKLMMRTSQESMVRDLSNDDFAKVYNGQVTGTWFNLVKVIQGNYQPYIGELKTFYVSTPAFVWGEEYYYGYDWDLSDVQGWKFESENESSKGHCTRTYSLKHTWISSAVGKTINYKIDEYSTAPTITYSMQYPEPIVYGAYPDLIKVYQNAKRIVSDFDIDKQSSLLEAVLNFSTSGIISINNDGTFDFNFISSLKVQHIIIGSQTTTEMVVNNNYATPSIIITVRSISEGFYDYSIGFTTANDVTSNVRDIVVSYLELNGEFVNFDRYGTSILRKVMGAALYPAEDLFPRDAAIDSRYINIYPAEGGEVTASGLCKYINIDDEAHKPYDGIAIIKNNLQGSDSSLYPFYYNRQSSDYGTTPSSITETGYFEGQNYYEIKSNFFIENFTFTQEQLLEMCRTIIERIGSLRFYNAEVEIRALPYVEVGDSVNVQTAKGGYEILVFRRSLSGNIAMMDRIESHFE